MLWQLAGFLGLAGFTVFYVRPFSELRWVAAMLIVSTLASIVLRFTVYDLAERTMDYTLLEVLVSASAFMVYMCGGHRALIVLVALSALCIVANVTAGMIVAPNRGQVNLWELIANVCWIGECLTLCGIAWHERRYQHRRTRLGRFAVTHDGGRVA